MRCPTSNRECNKESKRGDQNELATEYVTQLGRDDKETWLDYEVCLKSRKLEDVLTCIGDQVGSYDPAASIESLKVVCDSH